MITLIAESLSGRWGPTRARIFAWIIFVAALALIFVGGKILWNNFAGGA